MNGTQAKLLFLKHASKTIEQWGFKEKKNRTIDAIFIRKKSNGFERFGVSTYNYYPKVVFNIGCSKRIDMIEAILAAINNLYQLNLKIDDDERSISYFGKNENLLDLKLREVQNLNNESGVIESSKILLNYIEEEVLPTFNLYDDIREIDKQINGEGDCFWDTDANRKRPFTLGQYFHERRLIIAWLSNNPNIENIIDQTFKFFERSMEEYSGMPYVFDRNDLSLSIPATIKYLKENVKPFY